MKKFAIAILCLAFAACHTHEEKVRKCYTIKAKHMENEAVGTNGDFHVVHYFLMTDGTLKKVVLKDYLDYNPGETICYDETIWVEDKK